MGTSRCRVDRLVEIRREIAALVEEAATIAGRPDDEDWVIAIRRAIDWRHHPSGVRTLATEIRVLLDPYEESELRAHEVVELYENGVWKDCLSDEQ